MNSELNKDLIEQLEAQYSDLQKTINLFLNGEAKAPDVKKKSSLLGIYKERDDTFMLRVRRTAGEVTAQNLLDASKIMEENGISHGHFSTRQNIQFHEVPAQNVEKTILGFNAAKMFFRGGGGNTFRNVSTSPQSGISSTEFFDTTPYADSVWEWAQNYEKAFLFGRKFKLGFTSEDIDDSNAGIQDLGFVPKIVDGKRGFKVYGGGGMGRGASLGVVLFEFLEPKDILRVSQAMIDLFYEKGNREVRSKARLRFVAQELGDDGFRDLFLDYLSKTDAPDYTHTERDYAPFVKNLKTPAGSVSSQTEFENWKVRAVQPTKFGDDIVSVRLFVRGGNLDSKAFKILGEIVESVGAPFIRVSILQDAFISLVHVDALEFLYTELKERLPVQAVTDASFTRHIVSCIGAGRCPIGILKAPEASKTVESSLNKLFENYEELRSELYEAVVDGINISGCGSGCGLNQVAAIGFNGGKKRIDGEMVEVYQVWVGGEINENSPHSLAATNDNWIVPATEIGNYVSNIVVKFIGQYKGGGDKTLREYMAKNRADFSFEEFLN
jgi:sulfite reductase beta subunit-like hemoprotein